MRLTKENTPNALMDYFNNHPKVIEMKQLMNREYAKGNYTKACKYASMLKSIENEIENKIVNEKVKWLDIKDDMTEEDNHILALKVNKLTFLADMIDEAVFSIKEVLKKYNSEFFAFEEFQKAATLGKRHINAFMKDGSEDVQATFAEFTDFLNEEVDKMIEEHIFKEDKEEDPDGNS